MSCLQTAPARATTGFCSASLRAALAGGSLLALRRRALDSHSAPPALIPSSRLSAPTATPCVGDRQCHYPSPPNPCLPAPLSAHYLRQNLAVRRRSRLAQRAIVFICASRFFVCRLRASSQRRHGGSLAAGAGRRGGGGGGDGSSRISAMCR